MSGVVHGALAAYKSKPAITRVGGANGSALSGGETAVTFSGLTVGDLLIAVGAHQDAGYDPSFTSGWTKIRTAYSDARRLIVVRRVAASSSHTVTFNGAGDSSAAYSFGSVFRNASGIGASNSYNGGGTTGTSLASPSLTMSAPGGSALFLATYTNNMTAAPNGMTIANGHGYLLNASSWAAGNYTTSVTNEATSVIVEILN
jgi:hypothetical protein